MNPVRDQGKSARENFEAGLPEGLDDQKQKDAAANYASFNCPYGPGEHRDDWLAGFGAPKETVKQDAPPVPAAGTKNTVKKGAKGATAEVVTQKAEGETSQETVVQTVQGDDAPAGEHGMATGAEVNVVDPGDATLAAGNDGVGKDSPPAAGEPTAESVM